MNEDHYIFTPGPVKISDDILEIGAKQTPYFRNQAFSDVLLECADILTQITYAPENSNVIFLTASGTAAMEASVINLLGARDKALVVNGGGFGQRFADICHIHGIAHINHIVDRDPLHNITEQVFDRDMTSLLINAHETSIGHLYDLNAVGKFCKTKGLLNVVDAIGAFITDDINMQTQHIDVLIASSQKGLALPPGLAFVILSPNAIQKIKDVPSMYFNFKDYLKNGERGQTPFTPAVTIILQLHHRLKSILNNGIENEIKKTKELAEYFRNSITHLPLKQYSDYSPNAMTALCPTDGRNAIDIVAALEQKYKVIVCPNGGDLKDRIFRVSHMGAIDKAYVDVLIHALNDYYGVDK